MKTYEELLNAKTHGKFLFQKNWQKLLWNYTR